MRRRQDGVGILVAGNEIDRHVRVQNVQQLEKGVCVAAFAGYVAGDADDVIGKAANRAGKAFLICAEIKPVQVADVQDAELLQILA